MVRGRPVLEAASEETVELLTRFELAYGLGQGLDALRATANGSGART
jgi:hypothetical protein